MSEHDNSHLVMVGMRDAPPDLCVGMLVRAHTQNYGGTDSSISGARTIRPTHTRN